MLNLNKLSFVPNWFFDFEEDNPLLTNVNNVPFEEGYFSSKAPRYNWSVRYLRSDINLNSWTELCMCCFIRVLGNRNSYQYLIEGNNNGGTKIEFAIDVNSKLCIDAYTTNNNWIGDNISADSNKSVNVISDENWHFVSFYIRREPGKWCLMLDDELKEIENPYRIDNSYSYISIGCRTVNNGSNYRFNGQIDNLMIWKNQEMSLEDYGNVMSKIRKSKQFSI